MKIKNDIIVFKDLPITLKTAIGLFAIHTLLYAEAIIEAFMKAKQMQPFWILHIFTCIFLISEIPRPRRSMFYLILIYSLVIATNIIRNDFVSGYSLIELLSIMYRTIILSLPLYLVAPFIIASRSYYFQHKLNKNSH